MPAILRIGAYRFYFYSHEPNEPPHIHIDRDNLTAKFWLQPVGPPHTFLNNQQDLDSDYV